MSVHAVQSAEVATTGVREGTEMTMPKFEPVAWLRDTLDGGLSTMTDCCTNVVKEIWLKANPKNVERYTAPLYTADQLTEAYEAGKHDQAAELEAARAEIERLENQVQARDAELWGRTQKILQLEQQLAAEQVKNVGLREVLKTIYEDFDCDKNAHDYGTDCRCCIAEKALSTPSDTSALEAIVKKAGEVMRERCASESCRSHEYDATKAIRTLPAVTLEDLK